MYIFEKPLKNVSNIMCHMLIFFKNKKYLVFLSSTLTFRDRGKFFNEVALKSWN